MHLFLLQFDIYCPTIISIPMKSTHHRKLRQGADLLSLSKPPKFTFHNSQSSTCECELQIWMQQLFQKIQSGPPVLDILLAFREYLQIPSEMLGKKSAEILISKSREYCLKNISEDDLQELQLLLQDYKEFKLTQQSILAPIYGIVRVWSHSQGRGKWSDNFMFMPYLGKDEAIMFDIKGYCEGRTVNQRDYKDFRFGKDENFIKSEYLQLLEAIPIERKQELMRITEVNIAFLRDKGLIDYSVLLIFLPIKTQIHPDSLPISSDFSLRIRIIDYLQPYNERKKLQNKFKSLFFKQISSIDPQAYASRLILFLKKAFLL